MSRDLPLEERRCRACDAPLDRREGERACNWRKRKVCNVACREALLAKMGETKREIPCDGCGATLVRSIRYPRAQCEKCKGKTRAKNARAGRTRMTIQSKRYRVLMSVLGWEDFDDLIEYLRGVPWAECGGQRVRDLLKDSRVSAC